MKRFKLLLLFACLTAGLRAANIPAKDSPALKKLVAGTVVAIKVMGRESRWLYLKFENGYLNPTGTSKDDPLLPI